MKLLATLLVVLLEASSLPAAAAEEPHLNCAIGPTNIELGDNTWLLYGCDDGRSVVVIAAPPNPAAPFVFIVTPTSEGVISVRGEGTGPQSVTKPAYDALRAMSAADIAKLHQRAKSAAVQ